MKMNQDHLHCRILAPTLLNFQILLRQAGTFIAEEESLPN